MVAPVALDGVAHRPLSILRCPDSISGKQHFYQKNGHCFMPVAIREGSASKQPYLAIKRCRNQLVRDASQGFHSPRLLACSASCNYRSERQMRLTGEVTRSKSFTVPVLACI